MPQFYVLPPKGYATYSGGGPVGDTLQNVMVDQWPDGMTCWVKSQNALYALDKTSVATLNPPYVLPATPRGRWILGSGSVHLATYAAPLPPEPVVEFLGTRAYDNPGVATVIDTGYIDARAYLDQFGITDPTTQDCTAAIQAAIDAGVAANKRIVLPPGRIYLAGTLSVNVTTYLGIIVIEGVGPRSTTLYAGVPGSDPRSVFMVAGTAAINPTFLLSNLCIDANGQRQSAFLVMGTYVFTSSLSNVVLTGSSTYGNLSVAYSASLLGCQFYNVSMEGGAYSIYADESSSLQACAFFGSRITGSSVCGIWGRNHKNNRQGIVSSVW
jgi:hypothetical protein